MLTQPIGGFFGLSFSTAPHQPLHAQALGLNTGRACFRTILRTVRPARVHIPWYSCATLEEALAAEQVPFSYYHLGAALMPASMNSLPAGEYLVYINYFDLQYANVERLYERYGRQLIVDNVQAFYRGAYKDCWSFNSARKFYGVPDGAYLYGPALPQDIRERNAAYSIEHLLYRAMHENEKAYGLYKRQEHGMTTDVRLMSELSAALLAHTDHAFAMERRRQNFRLLHRALGHINHFPGLDEIGDEAVPFFYPLLPAIPLSRASLVEQRLFIPQFWPERCETVAAGTMEAALVQDLLPLPIDQRYGEREMLEIVQIIQYEYQGKISHHPGH